MSHSENDCDVTMRQSWDSNLNGERVRKRTRDNKHLRNTLKYGRSQGETKVKKSRRILIFSGAMGN